MTTTVTPANPSDLDRASVPGAKLTYYLDDRGFPAIKIVFDRQKMGSNGLVLRRYREWAVAVVTFIMLAVICQRALMLLANDRYTLLEEVPLIVFLLCVIACAGMMMFSAARTYTITLWARTVYQPLLVSAVQQLSGLRGLRVECIVSYANYVFVGARYPDFFGGAGADLTVATRLPKEWFTSADDLKAALGALPVSLELTILEAHIAEGLKLPTEKFGEEIIVHAVVGRAQLTTV